MLRTSHSRRVLRAQLRVSNHSGEKVLPVFIPERLLGERSLCPQVLPTEILNILFAKKCMTFKLLQKEGIRSTFPPLQDKGHAPQFDPDEDEANIAKELLVELVANTR